MNKTPCNPVTGVISLVTVYLYVGLIIDFLNILICFPLFLSDILTSLQEKIDKSKTFNIKVTREDLYQKGLKQWGRQKQASPKKNLVISSLEVKIKK